MQLTIVAPANLTVSPGKKGNWSKLEVLYRDMEGKVSSKILVDFKNPAVFKQFKDAQPGTVWEVESVKGEPNKEGKAFWEWKSATQLDAQDTVPAAKLGVGISQQVPTVQGTCYLDSHTFLSGHPSLVTRAPAPVTRVIFTEADRNRSIVRQSSLDKAIATFAAQEKTKFGYTDVVELAAQYEAWVQRPVDAAPVVEAGEVS